WGHDATRHTSTTLAPQQRSRSWQRPAEERERRAPRAPVRRTRASRLQRKGSSYAKVVATRVQRSSAARGGGEKESTVQCPLASARETDRRLVRRAFPADRWHWRATLTRHRCHN